MPGGTACILTDSSVLPDEDSKISCLDMPFLLLLLLLFTRQATYLVLGGLKGVSDNKHRGMNDTVFDASLHPSIHPSSTHRLRGSPRRGLFYVSGMKLVFISTK